MDFRLCCRGFRLPIAFVTVLAIGLLAPAASADKPVRSGPFPISDFTIFGSCSFDVGFHVLQNNVITTTFTDGTQIATGAFKVRLTNLAAPGKTLDVNASGPGVATFPSSGGFTLKTEGPWLFYFTPGDLGRGTPGSLLLVDGLNIISVDASGNKSWTHVAGKITDLCPLLA
jgi:hypothetical protein